MPCWASPTACQCEPRMPQPPEQLPLDRSRGPRRRVVNTRDGVKLGLSGGASAMFRASGTGPVVRVYVEAQTPGQVRAILGEATRRVLAHDPAICPQLQSTGTPGPPRTLTQGAAQVTGRP